MKAKRIQSIVKNIGWLLAHAGDNRRYLIGWAVVSVTVNLLSIILISLLPALVVELLTNHWSLTVIAMIAIAVGGILGILYMVKALLVTQGYWRNSALRQDLMFAEGFAFLKIPFAHTLRREYQEARSTAAFYAFMDDSTGVGQFWPVMITVLEDGIMLLLLVGYTFTLALWLPLFMILTIGIAMVILGRTVALRDQLRKHMNGLMEEKRYLDTNVFDVDVALDIRLNQIADWYSNRIAAIQNKITVNKRKIRRLQFSSAGWISAISVVRSAAFAYVLATKMLSNQISLAQFTFLFTFMEMIDGHVASFVHALLNFLKASADVTGGRDFFKTLDVQPHTVGGEQLSILEAGTVTFDDVSYTYPDSDEPTLKHISFQVAAGERIALVGYNGAGKSTLILLLLGLLQPTSGAIYVSGVDTQQLSQQQLQALYSVAFQDADFIADTVARNVAMTNEPDMAKVAHVLEITGMTAKIAALPDGVNTQVTKYLFESGVDFSGGEKQWLMIARALYKDAPIQILDEPTAALDAIAESQMYERFAKIAEHHTNFFVSHRLASTQFADTVMFMQAGRIQAQGTHAELLRRDADYRAMYEMQRKNYAQAVEGGVADV